MKLFVSVIIALCLLASASTAAERQSKHWRQTVRAPANEVLEFRVALRQQNIDVLENTLYDVSDPSSANYGKHWSVEQILDLVAPANHVSEEIVAFLTQSGAFNIENHRDFIKAEATVKAIESIFAVDMYVYAHKIKKNYNIIRASEMYTVPAQFDSAVHMIAGITELPYTKQRPAPRRQTVTAGATPVDKGYVIPETIQNVYGIPSGYANNANSSLCLAEFQNDHAFLPADLVTFSQFMGIPPFNVSHTVGRFDTFLPDDESILDVQYGGATAQSADLWFWVVDGWMYEFVAEMASTYPAPLVVSISWGWPEDMTCSLVSCPSNETNADYINRVNVEFMKMGVRGITTVVASGDQGAPGDSNNDCLSTKTPMSNTFPGSSPYVLAVGATMLAAAPAASQQSDDAIPPFCTDKKCANSTSEIVCSHPEALITSGGGFSTYAPMPSYQSAQVAAYLSSGVVLPDSTKFNASNRAFPDVAALGHNYVIYKHGSSLVVDGTSASTPVWGGIIALLNSFRLNAGKSPLGFINPLLYSAPASCFNDITIGNNLCTEECCTKADGFYATAGWDPITGLGTPVFKNLLAYVAALP
ncbi:hypothetical protein SAMD00019534_040550 [Acytostelium subglobosum LB1]|uniref:hypothetical protein n=1 Tax=Acytostelium subglobosum LB1 TaxID=1410327 RepID=UPI000644B4B9|nr:hypothetical protein SAMD00019534_040550 [Acytostelium subglobosum LB1]GAM20880.1 hypothetical protein SAMD00019534_040550 [Acytostelium subglobosum LB1]|eukprot:XP_012756014.1 hypothetical protein SAMD00019534_040550 [Acytostelium subglobosum LB1]